MTDVGLRLKLLADAIFNLPWSFGGRSRMDKVWSRVEYTWQLMNDYKETGSRR
jgi:hypothetical protein